MNLILCHPPGPVEMASPSSSMQDLLLLKLTLDVNKGATYSKSKEMLWPADPNDNFPNCMRPDMPEHRKYHRPLPIMVIQHKRKRAARERDGEGEGEEDELNSLDDDEEIEEALNKKPSPLTPIEHGPLLYSAIEAFIDRNYSGIDPNLRHAVIIETMCKITKIYETTKDTFNLLQGRKPNTVSGPFVLEMAKVHMEEPIVTAAAERYTSLSTDHCKL